MTGGIVTLDLHGKNIYSAKVSIDAALKRSRGVYRIRLIHGFNNGTALKDMIVSDYGSSQKVKRLEFINAGTTDLVLREL